MKMLILGGTLFLGRDTLAWQRGRAGQPLPEKAHVPMPDVTLSLGRERALLDGWHRLNS